MKPLSWLTIVLAAASLPAREMDLKVARLIPPDSRVVLGLDVERYRNSGFAVLYPFESVADVSGIEGASSSQIVQYIEILRVGQGPLWILRGPISPALLQSMAGDIMETHSYQGIRVLHGDFRTTALLDPTTAIAGDIDGVRGAIDRWRATEFNENESAAGARQISSSYDAWFIVLRPLEDAAPDQPRGVLPHADRMIRAIEVIRGGIQFGSENSVRVEAVTSDSEDAVALAAIGRWIPGFFQLKQAHSPESRLINLIENLASTASGRVASLTFSINQRRLEDLLNELREEAEKEHIPMIN